MDAIEYFKTKDRMTRRCCINCKDCKLSPDNNGKDISCYGFESEFPEQAIKIVEDWSKDHPVMTNMDKYLEVIKEIFNVKDNDIVCANMRVPHALCNNFAICRECIEFWESEYKKINK